jgi:hypothetical protein
MFADYSVPWRREWGHKADVGRRQPPWSSECSQSVITRMAINILIMINFSSFKGTANCFLPQHRDLGAMGPSSSTACYRHLSSPTIVAVQLPCRRSLASHHPPLSIPLLVDCCLPSVAIALVAVACLPPSLPSLLPSLPSPSSSHATLVTDTMARAALAIFVDRHPHCRHHRPCHPCPLCHCHHHPPHALVVCHCPPSWSCGCLVDTLLPATAHLRCSRHWLIVMIIQRFQTQGNHQQEGVRGTHKRARQINFIVNWAVHSR